MTTDDKQVRDGQRIAKVLARAGIASRRDAERMIEAGRVSLNGERITSPALNIGPKDRVEVDGKPIPAFERRRLWLYHKPRGLIVSHRDPGNRPTVFEHLPAGMPRVVSVGRLDFNSEGLLLLTNDGAVARELELPKTGWLRRYRVRAFGRPDPERLKKLEKGITIEGVRYGSIEVSVEHQKGDNVWLSVALREGKNREIRKVLEFLGHQVSRLIRVSFGPFQLGALAPGEVREIPGKVLREQLGGKIAND